MQSKKRISEKQLADEERDAWNAYREATADKRGRLYAEVEPWAWARLAIIRRRIRRERRRLAA